MLPFIPGQVKSHKHTLLLLDEANRIEFILAPVASLFHLPRGENEHAVQVVIRSEYSHWQIEQSSSGRGERCYLCSLSALNSEHFHCLTLPVTGILQASVLDYLSALQLLCTLLFEQQSTTIQLPIIVFHTVILKGILAATFRQAATHSASPLAKAVTFSCK